MTSLLSDHDLIALVDHRHETYGRPYLVVRKDGVSLTVRAENVREARRIEREYRRRILDERPLLHGGVAWAGREIVHEQIREATR